MTAKNSHTALLWIVAVGFFMQALDTTIVNTALPSIARSLHAQPLAMQPIVVAYTLTMALLTPASGWLADRFGTRRVYFVAILLFVLGSLCCASAQSLHQLIVARVIQGIGGSMLLPIGRLAVLRSVTGEAYVSALAVISIAGQVGPILGPTMGGWLVEAISWHWIFLINLPIGLVGCIAVLVFLPRTLPLDTRPRFDMTGFALLSVCMVAFSLALDSAGGAKAWHWIAGLVALSAVAGWAYVPHARRHASPLFPLSLFERPTFRQGLIGNLIARVGASAVPFLMPLLFQLELGYSPLQSGMMMLPVAIAGVACKSLVSPLVKAYGYSKFLVANTLLVGGSIMAFSAIKQSWPLWFTILQLAIFGAANSMQYAAMNSVTLKDLSREQASSGNGLFSMAQMLAIGLGVTIGGALVRSLSAAWSNPILAFRVTFVLVGVVTLASSLVFYYMRTSLKNTARPASVASPVEE